MKWFQQCFSLINQSPSVAIYKKTPIRVWFGTLVVYSNLKIFSYAVYACVDNKKIEPRSLKCVFLGNKNGVKEYKLWHFKTHTVIVSREINFFIKLLYLEICLLMTLVM